MILARRAVQYVATDVFVYVYMKTFMCMKVYVVKIFNFYGGAGRTDNRTNFPMRTIKV